MIKNTIKKIQDRLKKVEFECSNPKEEFNKIIQPRRYKVPIFGNLGENNCLYVDFLFVSKYNENLKFDKKPQWEKESIKAYAKLIGKNNNSKVFFDILENLKFDKSKKANEILMNFCVDQLKDEIQEVTYKSKILYNITKKTNRARHKKTIKLSLFFSLIMLFVMVVIEVIRK